MVCSILFSSIMRFFFLGGGILISVLYLHIFLNFPKSEFNSYSNVTWFNAAAAAGKQILACETVALGNSDILAGGFHVFLYVNHSLFS